MYRLAILAPALLGVFAGHMMSGVSAPVAIKVFGPDLEKLRQIGIEIQTIAKTIPGFEDCKLDQTSSIPELRIEADRDRAKAYGIAPGKLNDQLSALVGGKEVAELREGQGAVNLVTRLPIEWRDSPDKIAELPIEAGELRPAHPTVPRRRCARGQRAERHLP